MSIDVQYSTGAALERLDLRVYAEAMRRDLPGIVEELRTMLGAKLVAYLGSVKDTRSVRLWTEGRVPSADAVQRLRLGYQVAQLIREVEGTQIVATWMQGANPRLDDQAPITLLRSGDFAVDGPRVLAAARSFIAR